MDLLIIKLIINEVFKFKIATNLYYNLSKFTYKFKKKFFFVSLNYNVIIIQLIMLFM